MIVAVISGPSSASASVAAAIRAVRDEGLTRTPAASSDEESGKDVACFCCCGGCGHSAFFWSKDINCVDGAAVVYAHPHPTSYHYSKNIVFIIIPSVVAAAAADGSWQDLFTSSGDKAVSSVASALAAVNQTDALSDLDLSFTSSSRGRRRLDGSNGNSSSSSNGSSTSSITDDAQSAYSAPSSSLGSSTVTSPAYSSGPDSSSGPGSSTSSSGTVVEVQKGDPEGPPPLLAAGDDDIFWVSKLHDGLLSAGYYPSDDEVCVCVGGVLC